MSKRVHLTELDRGVRFDLYRDAYTPEERSCIEAAACRIRSHPEPLSIRIWWHRGQLIARGTWDEMPDGFYDDDAEPVNIAKLETVS